MTAVALALAFGSSTAAPPIGPFCKRESQDPTAAISTCPPRHLDLLQRLLLQLMSLQSLSVLFAPWWLKWFALAISTMAAQRRWSPISFSSADLRKPFVDAEFDACGWLSMTNPKPTAESKLAAVVMQSQPIAMRFAVMTTAESMGQIDHSSPLQRQSHDDWVRHRKRWSRGEPACTRWMVLLLLAVVVPLSMHHHQRRAANFYWSRAMQAAMMIAEQR